MAGAVEALDMPEWWPISAPSSPVGAIGLQLLRAQMAQKEAKVAA